MRCSNKISVFILFEGGALSQDSLQFIMNHYENRRTTLYKSSYLKKVEIYGPWLISIEGEKDLAMIFAKKLPIAGVIFSELSLEQLANRLAVGCIANTPESHHVLLRYYTPRILKKLVIRSDMDWHSILFSQIDSWWIYENTQWQRLYIPISEINIGNKIVDKIILDEPLWQGIVDRGDISSLLKEWKTMESSHHFPPCIQRNMVEKALNKASKVGLTKSLDKKIYALTYLNGKKEYLESAEFQAVLEKVKHNEISLSNVY